MPPKVTIQMRQPKTRKPRYCQAEMGGCESHVICDGGLLFESVLNRAYEDRNIPTNFATHYSKHSTVLCFND